MDIKEKALIEIERVTELALKLGNYSCDKYNTDVANSLLLALSLIKSEPLMVIPDRRIFDCDISNVPKDREQRLKFY